MANADHYAQSDTDVDGRAIAVDFGEVVDVVSQAEVNQQIATARRYPRSIAQFRKELREMATISDVVAAQCTYILPARKGGDGKSITGPSVRFAEMVVACYGHVRSAARTKEVGDEYITAVGACWDVQRNNAIGFEVMRRITDREGRRYSADMIMTTGNAAGSIALRNAIFKVVPGALWKDIHEYTKVVARGDEKSLNERRGRMFEEFAKLKPSVSKAQIFELLDVKGDADVTLDHLLELAGILTAINDGDTTVEAAFGGGATKGTNVVLHPGGKANEFVRQGNATEVKPTEQKTETKPQQQQAEVKPDPKPEQQQQAAQQQPTQQTSTQAQPDPHDEREPGDDSREIETETSGAFDYAAWQKDNLARLDACKKVVDIGPLRAEVTAMLETPEEQKTWNEACDKRRNDILATAAGTQKAPPKRR